MAIKSKPFEKTTAQREACDVMNSHEHSLCVGGSRSGKTTIIVRNIILRAIKRPSTHLIARLRFNHAKQSLWHGTIPKVFAKFFPGLPYSINRTDWFITVPVSGTNECSHIWLGGVDDKERVEKLLGNEYSSIFANECSQISYDTITTLRTRLAESSGLNLKFYYDLNPPGKTHWTYQEFIKKIEPGTREKPSKLDSGYIYLNPRDNPHLPQAYLNALKNLPARKKKRFLEGQYTDAVEGALWDGDMILKAQGKLQLSEIVKIVVAVDPSVTNNATSDEVGIIVAGVDNRGYGVVLADLSGKMSTLQWAKTAVGAYEHWGANEIVAEVNQGGDLVKDALKNLDESVKVVTVHAARGKQTRAEPIAELYELQKIIHAGENLSELEDEMVSWVPGEGKSPGRVDALVWALHRLLMRQTTRINVGAI